jgi:hypothetical protein
MVKLAPLVLGSVVAIAVSCTADVSDEPVGDAVEPGLSHGIGGTSPAERALKAWLASHQGPCATACLSVAAGSCRWEEACAEDVDLVGCGGWTLTCPEAESAASGASGDYSGLSRCWEGCESAR